jgi:hypothetical protein
MQDMEQHMQEAAKSRQSSRQVPLQQHEQRAGSGAESDLPDLSELSDIYHDSDSEDSDLDSPCDDSGSDDPGSDDPESDDPESWLLECDADEPKDLSSPTYPFASVNEGLQCFQFLTRPVTTQRKQRSQIAVNNSGKCNRNEKMCSESTMWRKFASLPHPTLTKVPTTTEVRDVAREALEAEEASEKATRG